MISYSTIFGVELAYDGQTLSAVDTTTARQAEVDCGPGAMESLGGVFEVCESIGREDVSEFYLDRFLIQWGFAPELAPLGPDDIGVWTTHEPSEEKKKRKLP